MDDIFGKNQLSKMRRELEPVWPVHDPWTEQAADEHIEWGPGKRDCYTGPSGEGPFGPTLAMVQVVRTATNLATIFLFILPLNFFEKISQWTEKYAYKAWVIEKVGNNRDRNKKQVQHFEDAPAIPDW